MSKILFNEFQNLSFSQIINRLESALERIAYLENKIKMQSEEHEEDLEKFVHILGNSKEKFQELFGCKSIGEDDKESFVDSTMEDLAESKK